MAFYEQERAFPAFVQQVEPTHHLFISGVCQLFAASWFVEMIYRNNTEGVNEKIVIITPVFWKFMSCSSKKTCSSEVLTLLR